MDRDPQRARELLAGFAARTGLVGERPQKRYLWTDAFAVCTYLGLGDVAMARRLVDRVHHVLGRHRDDDARAGWISGLAEADGEAHPTVGGLRIGKPLPERPAGEPLDDQLEWERDGQYFHYLTKWLHALAQLARATGEPRYALWARELAATAHRAFVAGGRMSWKRSIDLSRAQVPSMGHHDPLDGYVTALELGLPVIAADYRAMIDPHTLATGDALGIGGLLFDAYRLAQLDRDHALREALVEAARVGLAHLATHGELRRPAEHRLAFRELGLSLGLAAAPMLDLARYAALRDRIEEFWLVDAHRHTRAYREHEDIDDVTLAASLAPSGLLVLAQPASTRSTST
ncbi:MAG: hypothetical protein ACM31C_08870 [Acidobacteriota bacterium]